MKAGSTVLLALVSLTACDVQGFRHVLLMPRGRGQGSCNEKGPTNSISDVSPKRHPTAAGDPRQTAGLLHASAADPSAPRKKGSKKKRKNTKQAVEQWASEALSGRRYYQTQIYECKSTTLPGVLSEFWRVVARYAQKKFSATAEDRDFAAHVLFVAARCDLLKDYGIMRHLDKVIDFCSGGCTDFGRTVTLQHYHPDIVLPPVEEDPASRRHHHAVAAKPSELDRVVKSARSPYPAFGLTVAAGSATRAEPLKPNDRIGRIRLDLEMLYNSVSGCSADDTVDAHGSPHGMIPSSPDEVKETTQNWLSEYAEQDAVCKDGAGRESSLYHMRVLSSADDFIASSLSTPEELFSEVWEIVAELQVKVLPILEAQARRGFASSTPAVASEPRGTEDGAVARRTEDDNGAENQSCDPLVSTLLVAPRLHPFNSALFENLARNVDIALKQTPIIDRVEVELYHPEYVSDGGGIDPVRRSPFPTLLIKHCGLKDELFEPSGMYRHSVPPLKLPVEAVPAAADEDAEEESDTATEVSADDANI